MNGRKRFVGLALLAVLLLAASPALALSLTADVPASTPQRGGALVWVMIAGAALGLAGTVTQTYLYPGSGTVPATAIQASQVQTQVAQVNFADADTTAVVTHNFGVGTTGTLLNNITRKVPEVMLIEETAGTAFPGYAVVWTDANTITINKTNTTVGSGGTVAVYMRRPHSVGQ